jgi:hypothetical protein
MTPGTLERFLAAPRVDRRFIRSKDEIDDYLRAERDCWVGGGEGAFQQLLGPRAAASRD